MIRTSALPKTQNSSPTPANPQVWPMRQQTQTEGYQGYNQLSPSRSPSGPTYTQLSSGINARTAYHTATSAQQQGAQPGMFNCICSIHLFLIVNVLIRILWLDTSE